MRSDTLKLTFTYVIALTIVVGGGLFLYATRSEPDSRELQLVIAGFIGAAISFVFNRESATQATRASQSSSAMGAATATTVTPGPPNPQTAEEG